mgnify:FL=1
MSITAMKLIRDAIERGDDLTVIGAKHILDQAIAEAEKQEPIYAHPDPDALHAAYIMGVQDGKKMREWVGLTDEEMAKAIGFTEFTVESTKATLTYVARAIEAKLKEKNT